MPTKPNEWGEFPELNEEENQLIWEARALGFAWFWPAYPTAGAQARNTLAGARKFLQQREKQITELKTA